MTQHTSRLGKGYLTKKESDGELHQMTWPSQSPDLNPIEMVWDELDSRVKEKQPTSAQHLWKLLQDYWKSIPDEASWENAKSVQSCHQGTYLGCLLESTVYQLSLAPEDEKVIRRQCINYIVAFSKELQKRLPDNLEALWHMALFSVKETLKHNKGTTEMIKVAELLGCQPQTIDQIVSQWRNS